MKFYLTGDFIVATAEILYQYCYSQFIENNMYGVKFFRINYHAHVVKFHC